MDGQNLSFELIDTHCHIDLYRETAAIIAEIETQKILTVAVTNAPFLFEHTRGLSKSCPLILPALGLHPELVATHSDQLDQFLSLLASTRFVGEVGLDYVTKDAQLRQRQRTVFETIVKACDNAGDKVLTVHSRRSAPDVLAVLGESFRGTIILHWYSGALRDLRKAVDLGWYFSVNISMLMSESGRRIIQEIPKDRLLTESDGPFAKRDKIPVTPKSVQSVLEMLASIWGDDEDVCQEIICRNTRRAFGWTSDEAAEL